MLLFSNSSPEKENEDNDHYELSYSSVRFLPAPYNLKRHKTFLCNKSQIKLYLSVKIWGFNRLFFFFPKLGTMPGH